MLIPMPSPWERIRLFPKDDAGSAPSGAFDGGHKELVRNALQALAPSSRSVAKLAEQTGLSSTDVLAALDAIYRDLPPLCEDELPPNTRAAVGLIARPSMGSWKDSVGEGVDEKYGDA